VWMEEAAAGESAEAKAEELKSPALRASRS
jgi:hypothetical protein